VFESLYFGPKRPILGQKRIEASGTQFWVLWLSGNMMIWKEKNGSGLSLRNT
jgi:hypothetical protein